MEERINYSFNREMRNLTLKQSNENYSRRHSDWIKEKIDERRNENANKDDLLNNEHTCNYKYSESSHILTEEININIDNLNQSLVFLLQYNYSDKYQTKLSLKTLRKELCKNSIQINSLLLNNIITNPNLFVSLANFLFDFKNSEIQLETLWIFNNLSIYCFQNKFDLHFFEIHKLLINFMHSDSNFSNSGTKNLILEKFFSLIGNLILFDKTIFHLYISNNVLYYLIQNLNSSVRTLRTICLWTINNIIGAVNNSTDEKISSTRILIINNLFDNKQLGYYIKFLFSRIDPSKNFDESYEFFYLLNYINIENINLIFLKDGHVNHENIHKLFYILLIDKLHQPTIRIFGNLLAFSSSPISQILANKFFEDKNLINFIHNFIQNFIKKIENKDISDFYLIKDILWLINNLSSISSTKVENYFKTCLMILLDKICTSVHIFPLSILDQNNNILNELIKNILITFYKIHSRNNFMMLNNEDCRINNKLINFVIENRTYLSFDLTLRYIVIDIIVCYIKNTTKYLSQDVIGIFDKIEVISKNNLFINENDFKIITDELVKFRSIN